VLTCRRQHEAVPLVGSATSSRKLDPVYTDEAAADEVIEHALGFNV
jgi:hypothetical protein